MKISPIHSIWSSILRNWDLGPKTHRAAPGVHTSHSSSTGPHPHLLGGGGAGVCVSEARVPRALSKPQSGEEAWAAGRGPGECGLRGLRRHEEHMKADRGLIHKKPQLWAELSTRHQALGPHPVFEFEQQPHFSDLETQSPRDKPTCLRSPASSKFEPD